MIVCKELNTSFETKGELFKALKDSRSEIISMKKARIQKSFDKSTGLSVRSIKSNLLQEHNKGLILDDDYFYLAVNSTKVLDSHSDLHLDGIWNKTVNEQQGKNYLVLDHQLTVFNTVVKKEDITMFTAVVPFSAIGKSYQGDTEVLIYKFLKTKIVNQLAKEWLESGDDIEASVRMQYVKLELALDSDDEEDKEFKRIFDKYYPLIANKEDFEEISYFWAVFEAKNVKESSLVLAGSNSATGLIESKTKEPIFITPKTDKEAVENDTSLIEFLTHLTN